ncbi:MAG: hypothetical protein KKG09_03755 [Verrucomicrobia bacterium]|nr:hypothetical protein [Verrucomicrobiota bacterium]MBU4291902.1 hypothetical protein [Verrucomicrobiota bacterium]MBU4497104.1 hypothetical protein [Verrucomicrobiota bacterium]MCG2679527.1 hypothetical protein [Kiritimatiellia bacterium]
MTTHLTRISADGHLHVYPQFRLDQAFDSLMANLDCNARDFWLSDPQDTVRLAFLTEGSDCRFFEQLRDGTVNSAAAGLEIVAPREALSLTLIHRGSRKLCLIAGRQIVTRERLEVLGLAMRESIPDGLSVRETISRIVASGGIPVLPWAPGKWLFGRGRLVRELVAAGQSGTLVLGDSSLRPSGWPEPASMRLARARGLMILPGSDPLPLPGEERQMGAYGFVYEGPFDPEHPADSVRALLAGDPTRSIPAGRRNNLLQVISRLHRLRKMKKDV